MRERQIEREIDREREKLKTASTKIMENEGYETRIERNRTVNSNRNKIYKRYKH